MPVVTNAFKNWLKGSNNMKLSTDVAVVCKFIYCCPPSLSLDWMLHSFSSLQLNINPAAWSSAESASLTIRPEQISQTISHSYDVVTDAS